MPSNDLRKIEVLKLLLKISILSIAGSLLGFFGITGVDIDPFAIDASQENAKKNKISNIEFYDKPLSQIDNKYDVVVANIISSGLFEIKDAIINKVKDGGILILSGILKEEQEEVVDVFKLKNFEVNEMNEWISLTAFL